MNSGIFHCLPFNSSALYYHQTPTRRYGHASMPPRSLSITAQRNMHFRSLWNGMFDRHRAEITIMQFIGNSLPGHHFATALWDFTLSHIVSKLYFTEISNIILHTSSWIAFLNEFYDQLHCFNCEFFFVGVGGHVHFL